VKFRWRDIIIGALALIVMIGLVVLVSLNIINEGTILWLRQLGYAGLFIMGLLTGSVAFIPIPGLILVFAMGSVLFPPFIGLVSGLGEALGSLPVYLFGYGGNVALQKIPPRYKNKFEHWLQKRGSLAVILMSTIANPFFLPFTAIAGMMRYGLVKFFLLCFVGKTVKNTLVAYLGFLGLGAVLRMLGVPI
jgi:membrane protein YqaA with SNARE-associated domain